MMSSSTTECVLYRANAAKLLQTQGTLVDAKTQSCTDVVDASQITRNLFLGSYEGGACSHNGLKILGITHNLMIGDYATMPLPFANDITYKFIQLPDHHKANIGQYFADCITFIDQAVCKDENILVNCWAGVSRSATVVIAYLIEKQCLSYLEAYETVRKARHWINPNKGFRETLIHWSNSHGLPVSRTKLEKYDAARSLLRKSYLKEPPGVTPTDREKVHEAFVSIFGRYHIHTKDLQDEIVLYNT